MIALISPAKSLLELDSVPFGNKPPHFAHQTQQLAKLTKALTASDIKVLMKVSDKLADLNYDRFQQFSSEYNDDNSRAAGFYFAGDVYKGLDLASIDPSRLPFAEKTVRILSGLYGLLRPMDRMQAYRLEMGTRLENDNGKNLYAFWGESIAKRINEELVDHKEQTVINLASKEYAKAIDRKALTYPIIDIDFKEMRNGKLKTISFNAKRARGIMTRYIIEQNIEQSEDLKAFNEDGYCIDVQHSNDNYFLFTK